jgi:hypothetical protein
LLGHKALRPPFGERPSSSILICLPDPILKK